MLWNSGAGAADAAGKDIVAVINGEPITLAEAEQRVAFQLYRLRGNIYQLLKRETEKLVEQKLLAAEAARRGVTVDTLIELEVAQKSAPVSDEDVRQHIMKHSKSGGVTPQRKERTRNYLNRLALIQRRMDYIEGLRKQADFKFLLTPPRPPRVKIATAGEPWRGNHAAAVTVVHFAAFNCQLCSQSARMIETLNRDFPDQIRWVHRNFFSMGDDVALAAAQLGEVAHEKGRFWQFHDTVFNSQKRLDQAGLQTIARNLDLGGTAPSDERFEDRVLLKVKTDVRDAQQSGVTSAPVMFVNGRYFSPTFPYARLRALVAEELNRPPDSPDRQTRAGETTAD
jgi:protein-disulfide isomerase